MRFAEGYRKYGLQVSEAGVTYREWAPLAKEVYLFGEFNNWDRKQFACKKDEFGNWELLLPRNPDGTLPIKHNTRVKAHILNARDQWVDRVPAWISHTY